MIRNFHLANPHEAQDSLWKIALLEMFSRDVPARRHKPLGQKLQSLFIRAFLVRRIEIDDVEGPAFGAQFAESAQEIALENFHPAALLTQHPDVFERARHR